MTSIFLVRHGEAASGWGQASDPGLSALGAQQAIDAANALQHRVSDECTLLSSPRLRARQTADACAERFGLTVTVNDTFQEVPAAVALAQRSQWLEAYFQSTWQEQDDNILRWRDEAFNELAAVISPVVVFTHFLLINAVLSRLVDAQETVLFYPQNASITELFCDDGELKLVALGETMPDTNILPQVDISESVSKV